MKTHITSLFILTTLLCISVFFVSCRDASEDTLVDVSLESRSSNQYLFPPNAHPHGKSYPEWASEFWIRLMAFDCETFFTENTNHLNQQHPVFMLSGPLGSFNMDVTIPRNTPIMAPIVTYFNDYPCPDPEWEPAAGQTLEDFLKEGAASAIDLVACVSATLDGVQLENLSDYRFNSDMFTFTGHPSLADCADPCVTGEPQSAVTDGYFLILKKLNPGQHTLHLTAEIPAFGLSHSGTFNITVE